MFTLKTDLATGVLDISVSGIWTVAEIGAFARAVESAAKQVALIGKRHRMLCDFTHVAIQPQDVVAALQRMGSASQYRARRCALYTDGVLARLQAKRIAALGDDIEVFGDRDSARAWLLEDDRSAMPAAAAEPRRTTSS